MNAEVRQFVDLVYIRGDGHCGFHSMVFFVCGAQESWQSFRFDLLREIQQNRRLYERMGARFDQSRKEDHVLVDDSDGRSLVCLARMLDSYRELLQTAIVI